MFAQLFRRRPISPVWLEPGELRDRRDRGEVAMIIDVRGPDEFDGPLGHIEGALNIPLTGLGARALPNSPAPGARSCWSA